MEGELAGRVGRSLQRLATPMLPWFGHVDDLGRYSLLVVLARVENGIKM